MTPPNPLSTLAIRWVWAGLWRRPSHGYGLESDCLEPRNLSPFAGPSLHIHHLPLHGEFSIPDLYLSFSLIALLQIIAYYPITLLASLALIRSFHVLHSHKQPWVLPIRQNFLTSSPTRRSFSSPILTGQSHWKTVSQLPIPSYFCIFRNWNAPYTDFTFDRQWFLGTPRIALPLAWDPSNMYTFRPIT